MTPSTLLFEAAARGILLSRVEDRLSVDAPAGVLDSDLRAQLVEHKADLLALLADQAGDPPPVRLPDPAAHNHAPWTEEVASWPPSFQSRWAVRVAHHESSGGGWSREDAERLATVDVMGPVSARDYGVENHGLPYDARLARLLGPVPEAPR